MTKWELVFARGIMGGVLGARAYSAPYVNVPLQKC